VTAIIGFSVKNSVFVASDSQMSDTGAGTKRRDSKKIAIIKFKNGVGCLIARAGAVSTADLFQDIYSEEAAAIEFSSWRTAAMSPNWRCVRRSKKCSTVSITRNFKKGKAKNT